MQATEAISELRGNEALDFAKDHLVKVRTDESGWVIEYQDPKCGEAWILDYPNSEYHGGGSPRLRNMKVWREKMDHRLHTELWTSWASLLRSYAAAHGLNSTQHAVVEVSADEITLRVGSRWLRFTQHQMQPSDAPAVPFALNENGTVTIKNDAEQEMDIAAEQFARELLTNH
jgi:hypothetical protein